MVKPKHLAVLTKHIFSSKKKFIFIEFKEDEEEKIVGLLKDRFNIVRKDLKGF